MDFRVQPGQVMWGGNILCPGRFHVEGDVSSGMDVMLRALNSKGSYG